MAADKILYTDKVTISPKPNPANELWREEDANEVKAVVNTHADELDSLNNLIGFINANIITSVVDKTSDFTIDDGDEGSFFICDSASDITVTLDTVANGAIPVNSTVYFIRKGDGNLIIDGAAVTVYAQENGTADNYQVELKYGAIAVNHYATDNYIISGNLLVV